MQSSFIIPAETKTTTRMILYLSAEWIPETAKRWEKQAKRRRAPRAEDLDTGATGRGLTIIDPAPYERIRDFLVNMVDHLNYIRILKNQHPGFLPEFERVTKPRLYKLLSRIETILDPSKVRLINTTLGEALREHPELHGSADAVIDGMGAGFTPSLNFHYLREE